MPDGMQMNEGESCLRWEAALADLQDGTLAPAEVAAFERHAATCPPCLLLLREAGHGREWVRMLHEAPPVPEALLGKILARTSAAEAMGAIGMHEAAMPSDFNGSAMPLQAGNVLVLPAASWNFHGQREARLLMTAAMAFFSVALTLSVVGFHLGNVHAAVRAPGTIGASASRQFFDTKKQVVSFYDNLRLVREMEATVQDLRHNTTDQLEKTKHSEQPQPSARENSPATQLPAMARESTGFSIKADERTTL